MHGFSANGQVHKVGSDAKVQKSTPTAKAKKKMNNMQGKIMTIGMLDSMTTTKTSTKVHHESMSESHLDTDMRVERSRQ